MTVGVYPGSFNPPTVAHLAIAEAAVHQCGLERIVLALSRQTLGKDDAGLVALEHRLATIETIAATRPWLAAVVTDDQQLVAEIAAGYDVVVMGADKWCQVADPRWYDGDATRRDRVVVGMPRIALAPRPDAPPAALDPPEGTVVLDLPAELLTVSATGARSGRTEWIATEARDTGRWNRP